jgi:hypothetical protein
MLDKAEILLKVALSTLYPNLIIYFIFTYMYMYVSVFRQLVFQKGLLPIRISTFSSVKKEIW